MTFMNAKYCKNCGAQLNENAAVCTKCGVLVGDGNKFCPNCGAEPDPLAVICVKCGYELKPIKRGGTASSRGAGSQGKGFGWAVRTCFSKYATFSGRARRREFWYWYLFLFLTSFSITLLSILVAYIQYMEASPYEYYWDPGAWVSLLNTIWGLIIFLPNLAVTIRRLHDAGRSGWYFFLGFIPIVGGILLLIELCCDSVDDNKYGPNPKLTD